MPWAAVIAAILELIPFVKEWLRKWLDGQMKSAASRLGIPGSDIGKNADRILRAVHDGIPAWQIWNRRKKAFVAKMLGTAPVALMAGHGLTGPEAAAVGATADACG